MATFPGYNGEKPPDKPVEKWPPEADLPDRLSFVPATDRQSFTVSYREAIAEDAPEVQAAMKVAGVSMSDVTVAALVRGFPFTVRVVVRSERYPVAVCVARHSMVTGENRILGFWVHPEYLYTKVPLRLTQMARLELPELPTVAEVARDDQTLQTFLREAGWTELTDDNHAARDRVEYRIASVARREYCATLQATRALSSPPARN